MAKICIVSPSLKPGGIERALTTLATEFFALGHEVYFLTCLKDEHFYVLPQGVQICEPKFKRSTSLLNKLLFYPRLLLFLRKSVKGLNPERVLVFGDWFSPLTLLALLGTKFPIYISDRTIPNYPFKFPIPLLKKWLYPKAAGFIAQTQRAKDFKLKQFQVPLNTAVIPNALPIFKTSAEANGLREKKILFVGRFAWEKDPKILVEAMEFVTSRHPAWKLVMAGSGPLLETTKKTAREKNVDAHIDFLGNVIEVDQLYKQAAILVLPSVIEGFPNTLIEAMSFGLPCICFEDIPHEDIVTDQIDGLLIKERSAEILAEAIVRLIEDESLRLEIGQNAKISVERFNKEEVSKRVLKFMEIL